MKGFDYTITEQYLKRIAEALEKLNTNLLPIIAKGIGNILREETMLLKKEGEKSDPKRETVYLEKPRMDIDGKPNVATDSKPLPKVVQTQNFVDVRECKTYSEKAYKLIGYDNKTAYIAKQHVIRTESIEGGGTRVIVSEKSAWVITKLEWK